MITKEATVKISEADDSGARLIEVETEGTDEVVRAIVPEGDSTEVNVEVEVPSGIVP